MSKLGLHVNVIMPGVREIMVECKPAIVKTLDHSVEFWREMKAASPATFFVGRMYLPESEQRLDNPAMRGRQMAERLYPVANSMRGVYDCWEGYNEKGCNTTEEARVYNEFAVSFAEAMHREGHKVAAYSFATGNPELGMWPYLLDGLRASDYLALHEYSAPSMQDKATWLCLRYRRAYELLPSDCRKPLLITECGIDGGVIGKVNRGWAEFCKGEQYLGDLAWYDGEICRDESVVGATIYCCGVHDKTWRTFDVLNTPVYNMLRGYWSRKAPQYWRRIVEREERRVMKVDYPGAENRPAHPTNYNGVFQATPWAIVLHGTAGSYDAACGWFAAARDDLSKRSSSHFVVGLDGRVAQCVPVDNIAWHAGSSVWKGRAGVNAFSIGIELETDTRGHSDWPEAQMAAAVQLARWLVIRFRVEAGNIVTHAQVAVPPGRKVDPIDFPLDDFRMRVFGAAG